MACRNFGGSIREVAVLAVRQTSHYNRSYIEANREAHDNRRMRRLSCAFLCFGKLKDGKGKMAGERR